MANVSAPDCPYTGPDCTFGLDYAFSQCYKLVRPAVTDLDSKARVAACIFNRINQFEQSVMNQYSYILTLWPALVGIVGTFGPDASDIICDSVWWSALLAITSAGLPGYARGFPPHHLRVDTLEKGEAICKEWEYSNEHPRTVAKHRNPRIVAGTKSTTISEIFLLLVSVSLYIIFNYFFIDTLSRVILFGRSTPYIAGAWYWLSASPSTLLLFAEILQDRVDLYEPQVQHINPLHPVQQRNPSVLEYVGSRESNSTNGFVKIPLSRQPATQSFSKVSKFTLPFVSKWARIFQHQWRSTQYRLLIRPASEKWYFQLWNLAVGLFRVALFAVGSAQMGNLLLWPPGASITITIALLLSASAIPRFAMKSLWSSSPRGADLIVRIDPVEIHRVLPAH